MAPEDAGKKVKKLLESPQLERVETEITTKLGSHVSKDYLSFMIDFALRQLDHAGLSPAEIESILSGQPDHLIEFGLAFLRDDAATSDQEEYPEGEEPDPDEKSVTVSKEGYGVGFGVTYAIYLHYLQNKTREEFVEYLKSERIPHAARFAKQLSRLYESLKAQ